VKVEYIKNELFPPYMTEETGEKEESERFTCPFCGDENKHEKVEEGGKIRWKCQNCGVIHA